MKKRRSPSSTPTNPPATLTTQKSLLDMTRVEAITYLEQLMERLSQKQARERAYLNRRAARNVHTPTDEAYEQDQLLEDELLALLGVLRDRAIRQRREAYESTTPNKPTIF